MVTHYQQLSIVEHCEIARLRTAGCSVSEIAAALDRASSTISWELNRNASESGGYQPKYAQQPIQVRCWRGARLEQDAALRKSGRRASWSPAQVSGRLSLDYGLRVISHESIYRFIYAQLARTKDYSWRLYLPRGKPRRGRRGRRGGNAIIRIPGWAPLCQRSPEAGPCRWEADLMLFGNHGQALLLHERRSRRILSPLPPELRRSVTFDNGTEFARHYQRHAGASGLTFVMSSHRGRKRELRMPSAGCGGFYRAGRT